MNKKNLTRTETMLQILKDGLVGIGRDIWNVVGGFVCFLLSVAVMLSVFALTGSAFHWLMGWGYGSECIATGLGVWIVIALLLAWFVSASYREQQRREKQ